MNLCCSAYVMEGASIATWVNDFTSNLNRNLNNMIQQINAQVAYLTDDIQKNIEETIQNLPRGKSKYFLMHFYFVSI